MPELNWTAIVQVGGGTALSAAAKSRTTEAIDSVEVTVAPGETDKAIDIQPGGAAAIDLLVIKSSVYDAQLAYKATDGSTSSAAVTLDAPQVFSGGAVALFACAPRTLLFTNKTPEPAVVTVFVARDATP